MNILSDKTTDRSGECRTPAQNAHAVINELMVAKANSCFLKIVLLGILAGVYIGFGCELSTLAAHDGDGFLGFGPNRILAGAVFSFALMLVIIAGGELFTGNALIVASVLEGKILKRHLFKNWAVVYFSNMIGAVLLVLLTFYAHTWQQNNLLEGAYALKLGVIKVNLTFTEAFTRGILCNWLVCLAVWMSAASKNIIGKVFTIFFPIMAFVALGYENCVANMFYIPKAMFLAAQPEVLAVAEKSFNLKPEQLINLNLAGFINNLIPVTLGNIVGAVIFIAFFYWAAYIKLDKPTG